MLFLLSFIKKDRQNEMLMEKLIQRFPKCTSINQKADLAYCIAQLKVNDKCIKCLNDTFKLYKDALFDEDVLKNFMSVVSKAKKNTVSKKGALLVSLFIMMYRHIILCFSSYRSSTRKMLLKSLRIN